MTVKIEVEKYPYAGVVGIEVEELTNWGWVNVLDTATVGTFPNYTTLYSITPSTDRFTFRARWKTGTAQFTGWFTPSSIVVPPTDEQTEQITQALIQKATRILMLSGAPLGHWGEMTEFGMARVLPDFEIQELLYGLRFKNWDIDLTTLVDTTEVIRVGLQSDPADFPTARVPDVQRAIDGAVSWVAQYLLYGVGVA